MKRILPLVAIVFLALSQGVAQYPRVSIRQIQQVPAESLLVADGLQNNKPSRWTLQKSSRVSGISPFRGDTVIVTALVMVPAKTLTYTASGFTMLLYDTTANPYPWGGILVRCNAPTDTLQNIADGFLAPGAGDIIEMTGVVSEFPTVPTSMNSLTQFQPIPGKPITIVGSKALPLPVRKTVGDFYQDIFSGGTVRYSTGEPFESMYVELVNLQVNFRVNTGRGTFSAVDATGNEITMYDASKFFTLGHGTIVGPPDTTWQRIWPIAGTLIDTLRGFITIVSGTENPRGYRICPVYRSDYKTRGIVLPTVGTHRRNPVIVASDSLARISVRVTRQTAAVTSVQLLYSLNNAPFVTAAMSLAPGDSVYRANIPTQVVGTFVKYFIKTTDSLGNVVTLANSAVSGAVADTSKGFFFYTVQNTPLTIRDIQFTPFRNGRSAYLGATGVAVRGVVTADTNNIRLLATGAQPYYMQTGNAPWNGLWFYDTLSALRTLRNGDSVTVTGTIGEQGDVTRLQAITGFAVNSTGRPQPTAVTLTTGNFGPNVANGTTSAEQYEGMLVRFNNVTVNDINPFFADVTEFEIDDGSGPILVRRDGTHDVSNVPADTITGKRIIRLNSRIAFVQGIIFYGNNRYKLVPRTNADFGAITSVDISRNPVVPAAYSLEQNYPNPFNPTTTIRYNLPNSANVVLKLYNVIGQEVKTLVQEPQLAGQYTVKLDATSFASGVYFYSLQAGEFNQVKKMMFLK